jgi:hypothetical protein
MEMDPIKKNGKAERCKSSSKPPPNSNPYTLALALYTAAVEQRSLKTEAETVSVDWPKTE